MKTWKQAVKDAALAGNFAGLASLAALAVQSRRENGSVWPALNAPSHWLWGDAALHQERPSLRYTLPGVLIHQLSAGFWSVLHEKAQGKAEAPRTLPAVMRDAALTSAVAAAVDLHLTPERLTPGFEKRLSTPSLAKVYTLFALGLAAGSWLASRSGHL